MCRSLSQAVRLTTTDLSWSFPCPEIGKGLARTLELDYAQTQGSGFRCDERRCVVCFTFVRLSLSPGAHPFFLLTPNPSLTFADISTWE